MNLPEEIVIKILVEYHGGFSWRNGKLMTRIQDGDKRKEMLKWIVPHPNRHVSKFGDICVNLNISEIKHYKIQLYFIDIDWREDPEPRVCVSLWSRDPLINKIDLIL